MMGVLSKIAISMASLNSKIRDPLGDNRSIDKAMSCPKDKGEIIIHSPIHNRQILIRYNAIPLNPNKNLRLAKHSHPLQECHPVSTIWPSTVVLCVSLGRPSRKSSSSSSILSQCKKYVEELGT